MEKILPYFFIALYVVPRFVFSRWFEALPTRVGYALELSYCFTVILIYWREISLHLRFLRNKIFLRNAGLNLIGGFGVFAIARALGFAMPWSFGSFTLFFLLVFWAPFLEELIFRHGLWLLIGKASPRTRQETNPLYISTALFSLGHFWALFKVPTTLFPFVIFQGIYTAIVGFFWGQARRDHKTVLAPMLLHALFNFGFFIGDRLLGVTVVSADPSVTAATSPTDAGPTTTPYALPAGLETGGLLVVDVALNAADVPASPNIKILGGHGKVLALDAASCARDLTMVEDYFQSQLRQSPFPHQNVAGIEGRLRHTLLATHGLHTLGVVGRIVKKLPIYHFSLSAPPEAKTGIANVTKFIERDVRVQMADLNSVIVQLQPQLVVVSAADTFEENFSDLKNGGYDENTALTLAKDVMGEWQKAWSQILAAHPQTWFVVPAGNGGLDWKGDLLLNTDAGHATIPATLDFKNLIRVASINPAQMDKSECLSPFSNYGDSFVEAAAPGEALSSWAPCAEKKAVKLTGTAQANALMGAYLGLFLQQGENVAAALGQLKNSACLKGRIRYGYLSSP